MPRAPKAGRAAHLSSDAMYPAGESHATARWLSLADGEQVRVVESGDPGAPALIFLHGWGCSAYAWRHFTAPAAASGWRTIAIDLRGHGLSDRPTEAGKYRREAMVDHLEATLDALGVVSAPIVAHSMGGSVAVSFAMRAPSRVPRLALFGPVGFGIVNRATWSQLLPPSLTGALLPSRIPRWAVRFALKHSRGAKGVSDEREVDEYWAPTQFPDFLNAMRLLLHGFTWEPWTPTELAALTQPLMLVFGDRDSVVKPQSVAPTLVRCLRGAQLHVAHGAGHVVPEERPEWALGLMLPFLGQPGG